MKKQLFIICLVMLAPPVLWAQEAPKTDVKTETWKKDMGTALSITQSGYNNWQAGGVNTLSATASLAGKFDHIKGKVNRSHTFNLTYGQFKQGDLSLRKATDVIAYLFKLDWETGKKFKPTAVLDFKTQFAPTYKYDDAKGTKTLVSDLFAPADIIESIGYSYDPSPVFSQSVGIGFKQRVVRDEGLRTAWGLKADENIRSEAGLNFLTKFNKNLATNVNYKSQLSLFMSFRQPSKPEAEWAPLTRWDNLIAMKVNKLISVNFEANLVHDTNVNKKVQFREVLAVGFSYKFY